MPLLRDTGLDPFTTADNPSFMISRARIIAVVVPSPAEPFVLMATCQTKSLNVKINRERAQAALTGWHN
jgi:hypothetical protein